jgi:hypothetical protein
MKIENNNNIGKSILVAVDNITEIILL